MRVLVGNTGVVGSTLSSFKQYDLLFNSKNIDQFPKLVPDGTELTLACLPATKWIVQKDPKKDLENIWEIVKILKQKSYTTVNIISTIDVYENNSGICTEEDIPKIDKLGYGANRYLFELYIENLIQSNNTYVFRLPALFNSFIKKNIIYDLLHSNNLGQIKIQSEYQWYYLDNLVKDMTYFLETYPNSKIFNLFPEPIKTSYIIEMFPENYNLVNLKDKGIYYGHQTIHSPTHYIEDQKTTLVQIKDFINEFRT
jgi:hypothetical protein